MPRILVVDDEPNVRRLIQINLERHGYEVETACDGIGAAVALRDRRPNLLIIDEEMPGIAGHEVVLHARRTPTLIDLPIILLLPPRHSAWDYPDEADMYVTKPLRIAELLLYVKRCLSMSSGGDIWRIDFI